MDFFQVSSPSNQELTAFFGAEEALLNDVTSSTWREIEEALALFSSQLIFLPITGEILQDGLQAYMRCVLKRPSTSSLLLNEILNGISNISTDETIEDMHNKIGSNEHVNLTDNMESVLVEKWSLLGPVEVSLHHTKQTNQNFFCDGIMLDMDIETIKRDIQSKKNSDFVHVLNSSEKNPPVVATINLSNEEVMSNNDKGKKYKSWDSSSSEDDSMRVGNKIAKQKNDTKYVRGNSQNSSESSSSNEIRHTTKKNVTIIKNSNFYRHRHASEASDSESVLSSETRRMKNVIKQDNTNYSKDNFENSNCSELSRSRNIKSVGHKIVVQKNVKKVNKDKYVKSRESFITRGRNKSGKKRHSYKNKKKMRKNKNRHSTSASSFNSSSSLSSVSDFNSCSNSLSSTDSDSSSSSNSFSSASKSYASCKRSTYSKYGCTKTQQKSGRKKVSKSKSKTNKQNNSPHIVSHYSSDESHKTMKNGHADRLFNSLLSSDACLAHGNKLHLEHDCGSKNINRTVETIVDRVLESPHEDNPKIASESVTHCHYSRSQDNSIEKNTCTKSPRKKKTFSENSRLLINSQTADNNKSSMKSNKKQNLDNMQLSSAFITILHKQKVKKEASVNKNEAIMSQENITVCDDHEASKKRQTESLLSKNCLPLLQRNTNSTDLLMSTPSDENSCNSIKYQKFLPSWDAHSYNNVISASSQDSESEVEENFHMTTSELDLTKNNYTMTELRKNDEIAPKLPKVPKGSITNCTTELPDNHSRHNKPKFSKLIKDGLKPVVNLTHDGRSSFKSNVNNGNETYNLSIDGRVTHTDEIESTESRKKSDILSRKISEYFCAYEESCFANDRNTRSDLDEGQENASNSPCKTNRSKTNKFSLQSDVDKEEMLVTPKSKKFGIVSQRHSKKKFLSLKKLSSVQRKSLNESKFNFQKTCARSKSNGDSQQPLTVKKKKKRKKYKPLTEPLSSFEFPSYVPRVTATEVQLCLNSSSVDSSIISNTLASVLTCTTAFSLTSLTCSVTHSSTSQTSTIGCQSSFQTASQFRLYNPHNVNPMYYQAPLYINQMYHKLPVVGQSMPFPNPLAIHPSLAPPPFAPSPFALPAAPPPLASPFIRSPYRLPPFIDSMSPAIVYSDSARLPVPPPIHANYSQYSPPCSYNSLSYGHNYSTTMNQVPQPAAGVTQSMNLNKSSNPHQNGFLSKAMTGNNTNKQSSILSSKVRPLFIRPLEKNYFEDISNKTSALVTQLLDELPNVFKSRLASCNLFDEKGNKLDNNQIKLTVSQAIEVCSLAVTYI